MTPTRAPAAIAGTAPYMSPEQILGRPTDQRRDIWSFGCVLYEMLAGRPAFAGDDVRETVRGILDGQPDYYALPGTVPWRSGSASSSRAAWSRSPPAARRI